MPELLDLVLRWVHVIAAIMWIGNSLLFNWLDRNLTPARSPRDRSAGAAWLLHSGGFYYAEKTLALDEGVELRSVHWFKWQAYTTWLSGAALLALVYWHSAQALLIAPESGITAVQGIAISAGVLAGGWLGYVALWRSPLRHVPHVAAILSVTLLFGLAWLLTQVFTARAAFLHTGALMATLMAGNVHRHIMPAQRAFVASLEQGIPGDERLSQRAKLHSIHNNYLTFPVIALMLSSHFPSLFDGGWLSIAVIVLGGAAVRHVLNIRYTFRYWLPALAVVIAATMMALYPLMHRAPAASYVETGAAVTDAEAWAVIQKRCAVCHSVSPADRSLGAPPLGVAFDTPAQVEALMARIEARAVIQQTMPPDNRTWMTEEERALLGRWIAQHRAQPQ